jgi:hypothetical protein
MGLAARSPVRQRDRDDVKEGAGAERVGIMVARGVYKC